MKITRLTIRNFYGIEHADYFFPNGIVNISGPNGSGKTSIVKALLLLFLNETEENLSECIHWDADTFLLEVEFNHVGKSFAYAIESDGTKTRRYLTIDGSVFVGADATNEMQSYFHPSITRMSMFSIQGENDLINTKPAQRREHLRQVYDIDFSQEKKALESQRDAVKTEIDDLTVRFNVLDYKEYEFRDIREVPFSFKERQERQARIDQIEVELSSYEEALRQWQRKKDSLQELETERKAKESSIDSVRSRISKFEVERADAVVQFDREKTSIDASIQEIEEKIDGIRLKRIRTYDTATLEEKNREFHTVSASASMIAQQLMKIQDESVCPVCGQEISEEHVSELEDELESLKKNVEEARVAVRAEESSHRAYLEEKELNDKNAKLLADLRSKKENLELSKESIEDRRASKMEVIDVKIESERSSEKQLLDAIQLIDAKIPEIRKEVDGKAPDMDNDLSSERDSIKVEISEYDRVILWNEEAVRFNEGLNEQIAEDDRKKAEIQTEISLKEDDVREYQTAISVIGSTFPAYIISRVVNGLESSVNEFLRLTYPKYAIRIKETKNALKVVYGPVDKDVRHASGFEQQVFSFAYKNALSQIQGTSMIVLDEVDAFADEENSPKFYETIGHMTEVYEQLFVITHKSVTRDLLEREFNATEIALEV